MRAFLPLLARMTTLVGYLGGVFAVIVRWLVPFLSWCDAQSSHARTWVMGRGVGFLTLGALALFVWVLSAPRPAAIPEVTGAPAS